MPLFSIAWKVTMYEEITQNSGPDAKKQTFFFTFLPVVDLKKCVEIVILIL